MIKQNMPFRRFLRRAPRKKKLPLHEFSFVKTTASSFTENSKCSPLADGSLFLYSYDQNTTDNSNYSEYYVRYCITACY